MTAGAARGEAAAARGAWLFSPALDLAAFLLPPLLSLLLCAALAAGGRLDRPLTPFGWLLAVVLVDVAHVYGTVYRVYGDGAELRRRPLLYGLVPVGCYLAGVLFYSFSALTFWRVLAYLAVAHFVRQQAGWVALSRRRDGAVLPARRRLDRLLDSLAIYSATLYPVLWWHGHLPRRFHWFVAGDFAQLVPAWVPAALLPVYAAIAVAWLARQGHRLLTGEGANPAKLLVVLGTYATWYVGIVALDSDVAFTVTNVLSHGVPYLLVVWRYRCARRGAVPAGAAAAAWSLLLFYLPLALVAFFEEGVWDRLVWHEHGVLFSVPEGDLGAGALLLLVPLLSLPQATHYLLDAWIWRSAQNPGLARYLGLDGGGEGPAAPPGPAAAG